MEAPNVAYIAGVIDTMATITTRRSTTDTVLPMIQVSSTERAIVDYLCETTGIKPVTARRNFVRGGCSQHCREKHQHVISVNYRWFVTGAKARVVLEAVLPYLRLKQDLAVKSLAAGENAPHKPATLRKMKELGWRC